MKVRSSYVTGRHNLKKSDVTRTFRESLEIEVVNNRLLFWLTPAEYRLT